MGENDARRPGMSRLDVQLFLGSLTNGSLWLVRRDWRRNFHCWRRGGFNIQPCPRCERGNLRNRWMRRASVGLSRGWENAGKSQRGKHRWYRPTIDSRHNVKRCFSSRTFLKPSLHVLLADTELSNVVLYTRDRPQTTFESPVAATLPLPILSLFSLTATHHWPVSCITTFMMGDNYHEA